MRAAAALMARFHAENPRALGIPDAALTPAGELTRWSRTLDAVPPDLIPGGELLRDQLAKEVPDSLPPTLVHGDFRLGNMLCVDETPRALIDWEIWSIGDPRTEMGWFQVFADHRNFPGVGAAIPGLPDADELIEIYRARSGLEADLTWFSTLGRFKMAVIMAHNLVRHREGRHDDPDQEELPATIEQLVRGGLLTHR
jgi:aminoglycoside phosphotransferase (APT) family kinase protein